MNVNGVTTQSTSAAYSTTAAKKTEATETKENKSNETGVVYEKSNAKVDKTAVAAQIKAANNARLANMQDLVSKMFQRQGSTIGKADSMWRKLASGNFTATADEISQAKSDIAADGYWGVTQTSERIFEFAKSLSGGDTEKMKEMQAAFEKGFKLATKSWGGELPGISKDTHSAVNKMFEDYYNAE